MISPSPTQPAPTQIEQEKSALPMQPEAKKVALTPAKRRPGQTPVALLVKAILRPILKAFYYTIRWIRGHKLVSLVAALLLIASIFATAYFVTGSTPLVSDSSGVEKNIQSNPQLSNDVKNWLLALRSGNIETMLSIEKSINPATRPPDSALYIMEFSESRAQTKWTGATVTSIKTAPDGLVDTYVEVDMTQPAASASGGSGNAIVLWHFATEPSGRIFLIDYVSARLS